MKPDQQRVCDVVMETVVKLCASGLEGSVARVQGVIGVTVDDSDVFLIHINDTVRSRAAANCVGDVVSATCRSVSPAHKRARHRLLFDSEPHTAVYQPSKPSTRAGSGAGGGTSSGSDAGGGSEASHVCTLQPADGSMLSEDVKLLTADSELSVVVVDSDDDDVKLVVDQAQAPATCAVSAVCKDEQSVKPVHSAADAVSSLCIADVVGSVSPAVLKDDLVACQADDDIAVTQADSSRRQLAWTRTAPARHFQVTASLSLKTRPPRSVYYNLRNVRLSCFAQQCTVTSQM